MAQKVQLRKQQCKDVPSVFYWYKKKQYRKQQQCKGVPPVFHWYKKRNLGNNNKSRASRSFFIGTKKEIWETTTNQGRPARFSLVQKKVQLLRARRPYIYSNRPFLQQLILKWCSATYLFQFQKKLKFLETILIS